MIIFRGFDVIFLEPRCSFAMEVFGIVVELETMIHVIFGANTTLVGVERQVQLLLNISVLNLTFLEASKYSYDFYRFVK